MLLHAIMDALFGAASLGDIGKHFPDTDEKFKGISSLELLERVCEMLRCCGYQIENIDGTVIAQEPKLRPYMDEMVENIAKACCIRCCQINVKATTEEHLGFTGEMQGISAHAVCLIEERITE